MSSLQAAGADFAIIPANSIHYAIDLIQAKSPLPVLNLVELVVQECLLQGYKKVGVLGVGLTMSDRLYTDSLSSAGLVPVTPSTVDQSLLNRIIYSELVTSAPTPSGAKVILTILKNLKTQGCDGVILGCTELPLVVTSSNSPIPCIDTTRLLAIKAIDFALS